MWITEPSGEIAEAFAGTPPMLHGSLSPSEKTMLVVCRAMSAPVPYACMKEARHVTLDQREEGRKTHGRIQSQMRTFPKSAKEVGGGGGGGGGGAGRH